MYKIPASNSLDRSILSLYHYISIFDHLLVFLYISRTAIATVDVAPTTSDLFCMQMSWFDTRSQTDDFPWGTRRRIPTGQGMNMLMGPISRQSQGKTHKKRKLKREKRGKRRKYSSKTSIRHKTKKVVKDEYVNL